MPHLNQRPQFIYLKAIAAFVFFRPSYVDESFDIANLILAFLFLSVGITCLGTFLIILRILLVMGKSPLSKHHRAYQRIQVIVLESGIIYSISMVVAAITQAIQIYAKLTSPTTANVVTNYCESPLAALSVSPLPHLILWGSKMFCRGSDQR